MSPKSLKLLKRGHENVSRGSLANPPLKTLSTEGTQFNFGHIEPTAMFGCMVERDTDMVRTRSVRRPRRLALMAALVVVSLLGAGALWQSSLVSHKLKEYIPRSEASSVVVVPPSPAYREPPRLPHSPAVREPPSRR
jgi:hypothetical protein